ncbi:hypothetical protein BGX34_008794 [Mortierella sp. NVP85]|nr:hypothetical protein BGX34_008794 [Mortierella sp. NVP85]
MDPKMDTGMILDDNATRPPYDVNRPVNPKEFIWIYDNILVGQATWLSGHALSQTLFTSCYVLHLSEIRGSQDGEPESARFVSKVLKPCVLAIAKSCGVIWTEMKKGQTYDEEDFMINKFGVSLYESFPLGSTVALLDEAEHWMEKSGKQWIESQYGSEATDILGGIITRIRFARSSYLALYQITISDSSLFAQAAEDFETMRKHIQDLKSTRSLGVEVEGAFDHTVHRKLVSNTPPRTIALLSSDEAFEQLDQMCEDILFIRKALSFSDATTLVNFFKFFASKKPAPGAFPRSILQTLLYNDQIIMGSRRVQDVVRDSIQETVVPPSWIFEEFEAIQAKLATTTLDDTAGNLSTALTDQDKMSMLKKDISSKAVLFIESAIKPFVDTLQIAGQNTSRQRRNLRKIIRLWESIQEEAEMLDEEIHMIMNLNLDNTLLPFYFVSWVYNMKLWVMEWLLMLGFELELYSTFEYSMIYCFVFSVLHAHVLHKGRIQKVLVADYPTLQGKSSQKKKKKPKKKKKKKAASGEGESQSSTQTGASNAADVPEDDVESGNESESGLAPAASVTTTSTGTTKSNTHVATSSASPPSPPRLTPAIQLAERLTSVHWQLARAVFLVLVALTRAGHLTITPPHLASHGLNDLRTLYQQRFKAFHQLSFPTIMTFEQFLHELECHASAPQILECAINAFQQARSDLERLQSSTAREARMELCEEGWRADLQAMINVCINNEAAIAHMQNDDAIKTHMKPVEPVEPTVESKKPSKKGKKPSKKPAQMDTNPPLPKIPPKVTFEWKYHTWWPVINLV